MDPVYEGGPWTRSKEGVHGPGVHVLSSPVKNSSPQPTIGGQSADCWPFGGRQVLAYLSIISMLAQWTATCAGDILITNKALYKRKS